MAKTKKNENKMNNNESKGMNKDELIQTMVHRFGVQMGEKFKANQLRREIKDHENTPKIREKKEEIKRCVNTLVRYDHSKEEREKMRNRKWDLEEVLNGLQREETTERLKEIARNENLQISDIKLEEIVTVSNGSLRTAINELQKWHITRRDSEISEIVKRYK